MISAKGVKKITRREFLNSLLALLSVPALLWWLYVGRRNKKMKKGEKPIMLGNELPAGISFIGSAVLINNGIQARAFEAKCTHLGCRIHASEGDALVCQCHGSRFDLSGSPLKGPAKAPLKEMEIIKDKQGNYLIRYQ